MYLLLSFRNVLLASMEHLFIQPGLSQLQPSLDDEFMDTLEPLPLLQGLLIMPLRFYIWFTCYMVKYQPG